MIHQTVSQDTFEFELHLFYISQRVIQKFCVKLPFSKENAVWFGCSLKTRPIPFSILVFSSTTIDNTV